MGCLGDPLVNLLLAVHGRAFPPLSELPGGSFDDVRIAVEDHSKVKFMIILLVLVPISGKKITRPIVQPNKRC